MLVPRCLRTPGPLRSRRGPRHQRRLFLVEPLEERTLLATVAWDGGAGTFNWNDATNWDTNTLPGPSDEAVIPDLAGTPTITLAGGTHAIAGLTSRESLALSGGTLVVDGPLLFSGTFTLSGGASLRNANVAGDAGALMQVTGAGGTLDGVTLGVDTTLRQGPAVSGSAGNQVTVHNGLTLAGGATLRLERPITSATSNGAAFYDVGLNFAGGAQVLGGAGVVELFHGVDPAGGAADRNVRVRPVGAGSSLTIGPGVTVRTAAGSDLATLGDPTLPLVIQGTVSAQSSGRTLRVNGSTVFSTGTLESLTGELDVNNLTGDVNGTSIVNGDLDLDGTYSFNRPVSLPPGSGSLTLRGDWTNASTINQSGGTIHLGSTFRVASMGAFVGTAGTVNIFGTVDDPGATLAIGAARVWQVSGGTLRGVTVAGDAGALMQVTGAGGTLDGVTLGVDTTLRQGPAVSGSAGNQVTVHNGLTLAGGATLRLERPITSATSNGAAFYDVGLNFAGGAQVLGGAGVVELFHGVDPAGGAADRNVRVRPVGAGSSLTIGPGVTVRTAAGSDLATLGDPTLPLVIQGTVSAQSSGRTLRVNGSTVTSPGILQTSNSGTLNINQSLAIEEAGILAGLGSGMITISGDLIGDTRNADRYNPRGTVRLDGAGNSTTPQRLEAMGRDLGAGSGGFARNFVYGILALANNTSVRLVDLHDNAAGTEAEAVYVSFLVVPAGTTLDLGGLNLYARAALIDGVVVGGSVTLTLDSGPISHGTPTPGTIAVPDELDEWRFFGRDGQSITVVVNPGPGGSPAPLPPRLNLADVQIIDPAGNVLASGRSTSSGAGVLLKDVSLPGDGTYRIHVRGAQATSVGNYVVTVWDSTIDESALTLGQQHTGQLETPYSRDRWTFSATTGQQVTFDLVGTSAQGPTFALTGPSGAAILDPLTDDSGLVNLPESGTYTLTVASPAGQPGAYTFRLLETTQVELIPETPYSGTFAGTGQAQLFRVDVPEGSPLRVHLDDSSDTDRNEVYLRFGTPPTRGDFQFRATTQSADQTLVVPHASPGTWYVLVYTTSAPLPSPFTLTAIASSLFLDSVTPDHHGNGTDAVLTLSGAGFDRSTAIELVADDGTTLGAANVQVDMPTRLTATFATGSVPPGVYSIRARLAIGVTAELPGAFRMEPGGAAHLETNLVLPSGVGRQASATIYVEYANMGTVAMPAPLLVLRGTEQPLLSLGTPFFVGTTSGAGGGGGGGAAAFVGPLPWNASTPTEVKPNIVVDTVQLLGSGATPGVLQPGERMSVPVHFAGLQPPWDLTKTSVTFSAQVVEEDDDTEFDWTGLQESLRPEFISAGAWSAIYANLRYQVGPTWGDYVRVLDENAAYLGRVGQYVVDAGELWGFEVQQAVGVGPMGSLGTQADIVVAAPGLSITFSRSFSSTIVGRHDQSPLGYGWSWNDGWQSTVFVEADGTVVVSAATCGCAQAQPRGNQRRFQPDARRPGVYASTTLGDHATLTRLAAGGYQLRESSGFVTRFSSDGRVDDIEDTNGNRVVATWTDQQLTQLTHSAGQYLAMTYNPAGRLEALVDSLGRTVTYAYDDINEHLVSVTGIDGQTTRYTYTPATSPALSHALTSIEYPDASHGFFSYDVRGRIASFARDGDVGRVNFSYDSTGVVFATDASGGTTRTYRDHRGGVAAFDDALGNRTLFHFDGSNNLTRVTDALGQDSTFTYDARGNLIHSSNAVGQATSFTYTTDFNRLASVIDARGNPLRYVYDSRGNMTSITYADSSIERFAIDARGDLDSYTNRRGQLVDTRYDADGRLVRQDLPDGSFVEYRYNARGNLEQAIASEGATQLEYLDPLNPDLPTKITYPGGRSLQYTYENGRRTSLSHPDGFTVNYRYDATGRLESLRDGNGSMIVQYHYDTAGRLARRTNGNGTYTVYQYDAAGQVEHLINHAPDGTINSRFDYVYDALGRRTQMNTLEGVWDYSYDGIGQLVRAVFTSTYPTFIQNQDLEYIYDAVGNRLRTIINGVTTEYTTNKLNQYTQVGLANYTYDLDGNLVARVDGESTETFTWDAINRLVGVATPDGTWVYEYDALGNRSATVEDGRRTEFLVDSFGLGDVLAEYGDGLESKMRYVHAFSSLVGQVNGMGADLYYDFDALGSTVGLSTGSGDYANRYSYLPFGDILASNGAMQNSFASAGAFGVMHEANGLTFVRSRYYSSLDGRFISQDPAGLNGGDINLYNYVGNKPVSLVDVNGRQAVEPSIALKWGPLEYDGNSVAGWWDPDSNEIVLDVSSSRFPQVICTYIHERQHFLNSVGGPYDCYENELVAFRASYRCSTALGIDGISSLFWIQRIEWGGNYPGCERDTNPYGLVPPPPDLPSDDRVPGRDVPILRPRDPNEKRGPAGHGSAVFLAQDTVLEYRIDFENEASATAPAQRVVVTDQLDADLDWASLQFTEFGFGGRAFAVPSGSRYVFMSIPVALEDRSIEVDVELSLNLHTGLITSTLQTFDPVTDLPPDVFTGFLPPEDGTGRGQGYFSYIVQPRAGLPTGTEIRNVALITFDGELAIATNQVDPHDPSLGTDPARDVLNTIDAGAPVSQVAPLPASTSDVNITLTWTGQDDVGGSGIADYRLYMATDGGPFLLVMTTAETSRSLSLASGHAYAFYTIARDNVGHLEDTPATPDATTTILIPTTVTAPSDRGVNEGDVVGILDASYSSSDDPSHLTLTIHWGDGTSEPGILVPGTHGGTIANTHSYSDNNSYTLALTLTDSSGTTVQDTALITVANVAPTATLQSGGPVDEGSTGIVSFAIPVDPSPADTDAGLCYSFDLNNDGVFEITSGASPNAEVPTAFLIDGPSLRTVGGRISDKDGGATDYTTSIQVRNVAPSVNVGDTVTIGPGATLSRLGSFTDPGADTWSATVDYGDGSGIHPLALNSDRTFTLGHAYPGPGSFAVTVWVEDKDGATGLGSFSVYVLPAPVTVSSVQFATITVGTGRRARTRTVLVLQFSGALNSVQAQSLEPYTLLKGTVRRGRTIYDKNVPLATALYNSQENVVTLIPRARLNTARPLQLRIAAALLTDTSGRTIDGDRDGQPGGDFVANLGRENLTVLARGQSRATSHSTVAAIVDRAIGELAHSAAPLRPLPR